MSSISNTNIITMNRGDSFSFPFTINLGTSAEPIIYNLSEDSKLYLGVMYPKCKFEDAIIKKVFTKDSKKDESGNIIIEFEPKDTMKLNQAKYYYEIKLQIFLDGDEKIFTVQPKQEFWIVE